MCFAVEILCGATLSMLLTLLFEACKKPVRLNNCSALLVGSRWKTVGSQKGLRRLLVLFVFITWKPMMNERLVLCTTEKQMRHKTNSMLRTSSVLSTTVNILSDKLRIRRPLVNVVRTVQGARFTTSFKFLLSDASARFFLLGLPSPCYQQSCYNSG